MVADGSSSTVVMTDMTSPVIRPYQQLPSMFVGGSMIVEYNCRVVTAMDLG